MDVIKIFNYPWHIAHQYELCKLPCTQWTWLIQHRRGYNEGPRGDMMGKFNIKEASYYEPGKYDIALLHLDQQCFDDQLWERGKGSLYRNVNSVIKDIPKIVIMHGTPYYPENFPSDIQEDNYQAKGFTKDQVGMSSELINRCKEAVGDNIMVVNSFQAVKQWGFGYPIWHGLDPDEWYDLPKEPRVVTMLSPGGLDKYYDRTFHKAVRELLYERDIVHAQITVDACFKKWEEYRKFVGRSLIYFHPMKEAPMSRGRTEAMMSGCCVITTNNHDADMFIEDGINGFFCKRNPTHVVELIELLIKNYDKAIEIGQKGKQTAIEKFDMVRYQGEWIDLINKALEKHGSKKRIRL